MTSDQNYESSLASLCHYINEYARESGTYQAPMYSLPSMKAAIDGIVLRRRTDWTSSMFEAVELGTLLKESHKYVCSLLCPSVWHTDSPPQHCALCVRITTALAKHEGIDT